MKFDEKFENYARAAFPPVYIGANYEKILKSDLAIYLYRFN